MTRSAIRELVFKLLFRVEFQDIADMDCQAKYFTDDYIERYIEENNIVMPDEDEKKKKHQSEREAYGFAAEEDENYLAESDDKENPLRGVEASLDEVKSRANEIISLLPDIDKTISDNITGWTIERVGKVELTIIRLATYEIIHDEDVPNSVAINEAVELAKKYGQPESSSFINGVLSKIVKNV